MTAAELVRLLVALAIVLGGLAVGVAVLVTGAELLVLCAALAVALGVIIFAARTR